MGARLEDNPIFAGQVDAATIAEYQAWERRTRDEAWERRHFMPSRLAFDFRALDVPQPAPEVRLEPEGPRTTIVNARTGRRAIAEADAGTVRRVVDACDGVTLYGAIVGRLPPSQRAAFAALSRSLLGTAIMVPAAIEQLEQRAPRARLLRFPQQSPYAVSRAYWENSISTGTRLPLLYERAGAPDAFIDVLRGLHRILTLGECGRNYYGGASNLVTTPGELRATDIRTLISQAFLRTIVKWAGALGVGDVLLLEGMTRAPDGQPVIERRQGGRVCIHSGGDGAASIRARLDDARQELLAALVALARGETGALIAACARFHQSLVSTHPFANINNSLAMNIVNDLLARAGVAPLPHLFLDYLAARLEPAAYAAVFRAVAAAHDRSGPLLRIAMIEHVA